MKKHKYIWRIEISSVYLFYQNETTTTKNRNNEIDQEKHPQLNQRTRYV